MHAMRNTHYKQMRIIDNVNYNGQVLTTETADVYMRHERAGTCEYDTRI